MPNYAGGIAAQVDRKKVAAKTKPAKGAAKPAKGKEAAAKKPARRA